MRRVSFSLVVLLALTVLSTSVTANQSSADETKMSKELIEELSEAGDLEVIVQFNGPSSARLWQALESMGAEVLGELSVLDGGLISASPISLAKISRLSIVEHMELNIPLEYFFLPGDQDDVESMMHETIHVVNASMAWHRVIIGTDGVIKTESDLSFTEYDGEGATAVDLDTGIDGEHPDFDCGEPWSGEKLIWSAKWTGLAWVDAPNCNSDTSSGHGTHVGGTIAGNGDASAGRHLGTAKGASIVALGTGDGASIFAAVEGLEWTYQHSRPGLNEYNIRVVSNSWGTNGDYNPNNAVTLLTDMLTYDNGVAVIFAASNSGGSGEESEDDLRTNVYANTPSAISIAALTHDGGAVTSFSSRGWSTQQHTWPDLGAPGRNIWATAPRGTAIDASTTAQGDLYYMAISGTSMATPHIGGIATLLIAAAPSLGVADYQIEDHDEGQSQYFDASAKGLQFEDWNQRNESRVHEVELILELTSNYEVVKNSCEDGNEDDPCDNIPEECYISSNTGMCHDWRVGHGLVNTDKALALARTLQIMRDPDEDGFVDNPAATVWDAFAHYENIMDTREIPMRTDQLRHAWKGEWSHFNNGPTSTFGTYSTDDRHYVWVPNGTFEMQISFSSLGWDTNTAQVAQIRPNVDLGSDGNDDAQGQGTVVGDTIFIQLDVNQEHWGKWTEFDVTGTAISLPFNSILSGSEFLEPRVPYTVDVLLTLDVTSDIIVEVPIRNDGYSDLDPAPPSDLYDPSSANDLVMLRPVYDESLVPKYNKESTFLSESGIGILTFLFALVIILLIVGGATSFLILRRGPKSYEAELVTETETNM
ncbi:MAG: S8 family serine peptidase [Candidatus Thermoplasmatota archaeon]|nr:S8 family serine peptidase [Candidatus Thermoplasmatota archaeon]MED5303796.1 S8 family serine peptidase [Candidatus Thermoplasmatota archaeon]